MFFLVVWWDLAEIFRMESKTMDDGQALLVKEEASPKEVPSQCLREMLNEEPTAPRALAQFRSQDKIRVQPLSSRAPE